jgi:hypothetical protein
VSSRLAVSHGRRRLAIRAAAREQASIFSFIIFPVT